MSGHTFFGERWLGFDDGLYAGARLLEMCKTETPYCTAYVAAVVDTLTPLSEPGGALPARSLASSGR